MCDCSPRETRCRCRGTTAPEHHLEGGRSDQFFPDFHFYAVKTSTELRQKRMGWREVRQMSSESRLWWRECVLAWCFRNVPSWRWYCWGRRGLASGEVQSQRWENTRKQRRKSAEPTAQKMKQFVSSEDREVERIFKDNGTWQWGRGCDMIKPQEVQQWRIVWLCANRFAGKPRRWLECVWWGAKTTVDRQQIIIAVWNDDCQHVCAIPPWNPVFNAEQKSLRQGGRRRLSGGPRGRVLPLLRVLDKLKPETL